MKALIVAALFLAACSSPGRLPSITAAEFGYYVDHPDRPIPPDHLCNAYAEAAFARLQARDLKPFYIVVYITAFDEYHIVAAVKTPNGPMIYDNLYNERPVLLSNALGEDGPGYVIRGVEIDGEWYAPSAVPDA